MWRLQEDTTWANPSFQDAKRYLHPNGGGVWSPVWEGTHFTPSISAPAPGKGDPGVITCALALARVAKGWVLGKKKLLLGQPGRWKQHLGKEASRERNRRQASAFCTLSRPQTNAEGECKREKNSQWWEETDSWESLWQICRYLHHHCHASRWSRTRS